jgi:hypothetical protein
MWAVRPAAMLVRPSKFDFVSRRALRCWYQLASRSPHWCDRSCLPSDRTERSSMTGHQNIFGSRSYIHLRVIGHSTMRLMPFIPSDRGVRPRV